MKVRVKQIEGLALAAMGESRHWTIMDSMKQFDGAEGASKPMEMVLMALGGCTGMDVLSILKKMRQPIDDLEIMLDADQAETYPKVFTKIVIRYRIFGRNVDPEKVEKAIDLSKEKYCSVSAMLRTRVAIEQEYEIVEKQTD